MEDSKVSILENFSLIFKIMPYYGPTHKVFLLLSWLCVKSRQKLNEFYWEFRKFMAKYSFELDIDEDVFYQLDLPSDLFRFKLTIDSFSNKSFKKFTDLVEKIVNKQGYYFNYHYMHELLNINELFISDHQAEMLLPFIVSIISVKVYNDLYFNSNRRFEASLIEKIIVRSFNFKLQNSKVSLVLSEDPQAYTIFENFKRIDMLDQNDCQDILLDFEFCFKNYIRIEKVYLYGDKEETLEIYTDPEYLKGRVNNLHYEFKAHHEISLKSLENISIIKPQKVIFTSALGTRESFEMNKILTSLPSDIKVEFGEIQTQKINLVFNDLYFKIIETEINKTTILKWTSLSFSFNSRDTWNYKILKAKENLNSDVIMIYSDSHCLISVENFTHYLNLVEKEKANGMFSEFKLDLDERCILLIQRVKKKIDTMCIKNDPCAK